ncbi:MAG: bifunctional glutamate N-acetyltransferase/amino-acid acetyltransferase ArgJ [Ignavibacteriaceae bacterium]|jgi:glutamate N-acetyltransferase/amino-acid N-acetyltransferase
MYQFIKNGSVTSTKGFKAAGIHCGVKEKSKKLDLALIYSAEPCTVVGTYTLNKVKAAPLLISRDTVKKSKYVKAVVVNSGNANACTGEEGYLDALDMQKKCAEGLNIRQHEVLIASTGVIGQKLPLNKIISGIDKIIPRLSIKGGIDAANAIMTTDLKVKSYALKVKLASGNVTIGAICKGSGMIMPNMATMLAFISTDAKISKSVLYDILLDSVKKSFNKISVDGDTSTNDMVILLANGASDILIEKNSRDYNLFKDALDVICIKMAKSIVSDGEGATKLITINVKHAKSEKEADIVAKSISNSPLVKTAFYGGDANWGRILSAAGQSGADIDPAKVSISFDKLPVLLPNYKLVIDEVKAAKILAKPEISVTIDLGNGLKESTWWMCDLSEDYVKINANYRT